MRPLLLTLCLASSTSLAGEELTPGVETTFKRGEGQTIAGTKTVVTFLSLEVQQCAENGNCGVAYRPPFAHFSVSGCTKPGADCPWAVVVAATDGGTENEVAAIVLSTAKDKLDGWISQCKRLDKQACTTLARLSDSEQISAATRKKLIRGLKRQ